MNKQENVSHIIIDQNVNDFTEKETINKMKDNIWTGKIYLQMMQLTQASFPKYTNSSCNSTTTTTTTTTTKIQLENRQKS